MSENPIKPLPRRHFLQLAGVASTLIWGRTSGIAAPASLPPGSLGELRQVWATPPDSCWPRTRWWWPGNAVTREEIRWELEGMKANGLRGVELTSIWPVFEKGNLQYLSQPWLEMVRYAVETASELGMSFALTMGPGWDFGGFWVPTQHRSKCLACGWVDLEGETEFSGELPGYVRPKDKGRIPWIDEEPLRWTAPDADQVIALVAGKLEGGKLDASSLIDLTGTVTGNRAAWKAPRGEWRLMAFRLKYTGQKNSAQNYQPENWVIDHYNEGAVAAYCEFLGDTFQGAFGEYFGKTVDSQFSDSFEVVPLWNTVLWSNRLLEQFRAKKGYDFTRYLPAIWFDLGEETPRLRYDLNEFLHRTVMETFFAPFRNWCERHHVQARLQPHYRFADEIIEAAGNVPRPETEISTARFESIPDPRKATVSGARFYGRPYVSCEAYTFLHRERYRTTLEEMKRATDAFLRDGVTQFYNHGYLYSPEREPVPSRDFVATTRVSHWNTWWPYYRGLAEYIARMAAVLRQGVFVGDVLLFSPHADYWSERAIFEIERRYQNYGNLPQTLLANGYDYDLVNDDVLLREASVKDGVIEIRGHRYPVLVLPECEYIHRASLEKIQALVMGGASVFALGRLPSRFPGLRNFKKEDAAVKRLVAALFAAEGGKRSHAHGGTTWFLPEYKLTKPPLNTNEIPYQPTPSLDAQQGQFLAALESVVAPDVVYTRSGQSNGLCHHHRRLADADIYFLTNLQPGVADEEIILRVNARSISRWDPLTGAISATTAIPTEGGRTRTRVSLPPWASEVLVLAHEEEPSLPAQTGPARVIAFNGNPGAFLEAVEIAGPWTIEFSGVGGRKGNDEISRLVAWNEWQAWKEFSGTGVYRVEFNLSDVAFESAHGWTLDLGRVGDVAELWLNEHPLGVRWMQPYRFEVLKGLRPGRNTLRIAVTNTLMPYVSSLKANPPVPDSLRERFGNEATAFPDALRIAEREFGYSPLPPAGLMGPVKLIGYRAPTVE